MGETAPCFGLHREGGVFETSHLLAEYDPENVEAYVISRSRGRGYDR